MLEKIAIVLPNWIGDVVMATPAIRAVRNQFPDAQLIGVMRPYVADVLAGTPWLDETLFYSPKGDPRLSRRRLVRQLRGKQLDRMLLFPNSFSTALLSWLGGARQRVGFARYGRGPLLTDAIALPREGRKVRPHSAVDHYLAIAQRIGCSIDSRQIQLGVTAAEEEAATRVWGKLGLDQERPVVALNAGGAYGSAKRWPKEHCTRLATLIAQRLEAKVLIVCGPAERVEAAEIVSEAGSPNVVSLADESLSIGLSKACIARSDVLITTDSGPRHIGAALGRPTISLFGPTDPRWADNYSRLDTKLSIPLACSPCAKRVCPLEHHACMRDLTPEHVITALHRILSGLDRQAA